MAPIMTQKITLQSKQNEEANIYDECSILEMILIFYVTGNHIWSWISQIIPTNLKPQDFSENFFFSLASPGFFLVKLKLNSAF